MRFIITKHEISSPFTNVYQVDDYNIHIDDKFIEHIVTPKGQNIVVIGDCINIKLLSDTDQFTSEIVRNLKGHFIIVVIESKSFQVFQSLFGFLPVYHSKDFSIISNSFELIKKYEDVSASLNKRFILESYLFNYPFSNQTYIQGINRLDAFHALKYIDGEVQIVQVENVANWFVKEPVDRKKSLDALGKSFLNSIKDYFVEGKNSISFTSGFDGRTILSSAIKCKVEFTTFSLGRIENDDVYNPMQNSKDLGIPYSFYNLVGDEYSSEYQEMVDEIITETGGFNGFLYPHFQYGAKVVSEENEVLHTGYCGSELFRALHIQGAVTSKELVDVFIEKDNDILRSNLWNSDKLVLIKKENFQVEFNELIDEIIQFRSTFNHYSTTNHVFYYYIFTEVFRKVFGAWTTAQFKHLKIRTPFLDYDFIMDLLKTDLAGCNNEFFVHNPFKRLKGQLLYAEIIKQSSPLLFNLVTGKGYKPIDLTTFMGKIKISIPYVIKKIRRKTEKPFLDNLGLVTQFINNSTIDRLDDNFKEKEFKDLVDNLNEYTKETQRDMIFLTASFTKLL